MTAARTIDFRSVQIVEPSATNGPRKAAACGAGVRSGSNAGAATVGAWAGTGILSAGGNASSVITCLIWIVGRLVPVGIESRQIERTGGNFVFFYSIGILLAVWLPISLVLAPFGL